VIDKIVSDIRSQISAETEERCAAAFRSLIEAMKRKLPSIPLYPTIGG
jgi:hypothetical protein